MSRSIESQWKPDSRSINRALYIFILLYVIIWYYMLFVFSCNTRHLICPMCFPLFFVFFLTEFYCSGHRSPDCGTGCQRWKVKKLEHELWNAEMLWNLQMLWICEAKHTRRLQRSYAEHVAVRCFERWSDILRYLAITPGFARWRRCCNDTVSLGEGPKRSQEPNKILVPNWSELQNQDHNHAIFSHSM